MDAALETDFLQETGARSAAFAVPRISIGTRTFSNAVSDGIRWKNWKIEADALASQPGQRIFAETGDVDAVQKDLPRARRVESGNEAQ